MKILKWLGYGVVALVAILLIAVGVVFGLSSQKLGTDYTVTPDAVTIPTDAAAIEHGQRMVTGVTACVGCHGDNLEGKPFINEPSFAVIPAPNLTSGQGGVGANYTDADWVAALRHGVAADGRALFAMPSHWYYYLSDSDLGAIIAYLKTLPAVDNTLPPRSVAFVPTRFLIALGAFPTSVDLIAQNGPRTSPAPGVTVEYGEYLVQVAVCHDCHGNNLAGNVSPGAPLGPNLTPGGPFAAYQEADFIQAMRTGVTPGGRTLSDEMPWVEYQHMTDGELQAIYLYLTGLDALPSNTP